MKHDNDGVLNKGRNEEIGIEHGVQELVQYEDEDRGVLVLQDEASATRWLEVDAEAGTVLEEWR